MGTGTGTGYLCNCNEGTGLSLEGSSLLGVIVPKRQKAVIHQASFQAFRIVWSSIKAVRAYRSLYILPNS